VKRLLVFLMLLAGIGVLYFLVVLNWNFSAGERAGWVQKLSKKGWVCKTWEGEMAMVTMPGSMPEKFLFTVWDDAVAENLNKVMGKRVTVHYEEKVGLPTSCFGDTRHYVTAVTLVEDIPLVPGYSMPQPGTATPQAAPAATPTTAAPATPAAPPPATGAPATPSPAPAQK
jgi:hypothetical protein